jgi:hypothetical protein
MSVSDNLVHAALSMLIITGLALPIGLLFLRAVGLVGRSELLREWVYYPVGLLAGMLIFPLVLNLADLIVPAVLNPAALATVWVLLVLALLAAGRLIGTVAGDGRDALFQSNRQRVVLGMIALTALLLTILPLLNHNTPYDADATQWQSISMGDWAKHSGVGTALATGRTLPPPNPFLSLDPYLKYYYFGFVLPASASVLTGESIPVTGALFGWATLIAGAFPALMYTLGRRAGLRADAALFSTGLVILVGGLDFVYAVADYVRTGNWPTHIDAWAVLTERRINAIGDMFIWTPQHTLGIAGFLLALWLLIQIAKSDLGWGERATNAFGLSVVLAALSGTSTFVWFGLMAGLGAFVVLEGIRWLRGAPFPMVAATVVAAVCASTLLSLPYLLLAGGRGGLPFALRISATTPGLLYGSPFSAWFGPSQLTYALDFPLQMVAEFGLVLVLGVAGWWRIRRRWAEDPNVRLWTALLAVFFFVVLAVRQIRPPVNDYAMKTGAMAWCLLGLLAGFWWMARRSHPLWTRAPLRFGLYLLLVAGVGSMVYEPTIRVKVSHVIPSGRHEVYAWLDDNLAPDEIYQIGPFTDREALVFVGRRSALVGFYGSMLDAANQTLAEDALAATTAGYSLDDAEAAARAFRSLGVDYVVMSETAGIPLAAQADPAFETYFHEVFDNAAYRVYRVRASP